MIALEPAAIFSFLLTCSAKATVSLMFAWLISKGSRRRSAALRHQFWAIAILASSALPLLTLILPAWRSVTLTTVSNIWQPSARVATSHGISSLPAMIVNARSPSPRSDWIASLVLLIWLIGVVLLVIRILTGLARLIWISSKAQPLLDRHWLLDLSRLSRSLKIARPVRLLRSADPVAMPLTWSVFRPEIIVPNGAESWSDERRRIVLAHELAHISRNDWLFQILAELTRAFYWFHPLAWIAASRLRRESEAACDDAVLNSGIAATLYADTLLDLARALKNSLGVWSTALAFTRASNLERRFIAMLDPAVNRHHLSSRVKLLSAVVAALFLLPFAALRLPAQNASGYFSGTVLDPSNAVVPNTTLIMTNRQAHTVDMTVSDAQGKFEFKSLPAGTYELHATKPGFQEYITAPVALEAGRDLSQNVVLNNISGITETVDVQAEDGKATRVPPSPENNGNTPRLRIGGNVEAAKLITKVQPIYPESAKAAGVQGAVILHAVVGLDGRPLSLRVMNSQVDPDLARAAVEAVSKWRYTPTLLNGEPVEIDTTVMVRFTLAS
jgi:TonB family protein